MSVVLRAGEWLSPPLTVAVRARDRLRGLQPRSEGWALLLRGSSVHGIGMKESLWAVGLDHAGKVTSIRLLQPGRVMFFSTAHWILELPATSIPPPMGAILCGTRR